MDPGLDRPDCPASQSCHILPLGPRRPASPRVDRRFRSSSGECGARDQERSDCRPHGVGIGSVVIDAELEVVAEARQAFSGFDVALNDAAAEAGMSAWSKRKHSLASTHTASALRLGPLRIPATLLPPLGRCRENRKRNCGYPARDGFAKLVSRRPIAPTADSERKPLGDGTRSRSEGETGAARGDPIDE